MNRTNATLRNASYAVTGQVVSIIVQFALRSYFLFVLGSEMLGVHSLFLGLISILSFMDLGIGTAIVYSLYSPIALGEHAKVAALLKFLRKSFLIISATIIVLALILGPFLDILIPEVGDVQGAYVYFALFVLNTAATYALSFRKLYLQAAQQAYIITRIHYSAFVAVSFFQFVTLYMWQSYFFFLLVQLVGTALENWLINRRAIVENSRIKYLKEATDVDPDTFGRLKRNVIALIFHKIGSMVVIGGSSILIGRFAGLVELGIFASFQMIVTKLHGLLGQVFASAVPSIGNLQVLAGTEERYRVFCRLDYIGLWVYTVAAGWFISLAGPFVSLWLGPDMVLGKAEILCMATLFYLTGRRRSVQAFKDAAGLYWQDRWKPVAESGVFLAVAFTFGPALGVMGVLLAALSSTVLTSFWVEPLVMYRHVLNKPFWRYLVRFLLTSLLSLVVILCQFSIGYLFTVSSWTHFALMSLLSTLVSSVVFVSLTWFTEERHYLFGLIRSILLAIRKG